MMRPWIWIGWLALCACGPAQFALDEGAYDDACATNAECALVNTLACTNICDERAGVISKAEEARFVRERAGLTDQCAPAIAPDCAGQSYPEGVKEYVAICQESRCELRAREGITLTASDQSCTTSQECVVVNNTDPCDPCQCTFAGIRSDRMSMFQGARQALEATADCGAGGGECGLAGCENIAYVAACVPGRCEVGYGAALANRN